MLDGNYTTTILCESCHIRMECIPWNYSGCDVAYELYCPKCQQTFTIDIPPISIIIQYEIHIGLEEEK